jgi:hypothetical protein
MYDIQVDRAHSVIEATLSGMMTTEEVGAYIADLKRTFVANNLCSYSMVIDVSQCPIQQQNIIKAMGVHMASMPKARALAVVVGSALARMQVRRLFTQPYARIVATFEEGRAWVVSGTEPASP